MICTALMLSHNNRSRELFQQRGTLGYLDIIPPDPLDKINVDLECATLAV